MTLLHLHKLRRPTGKDQFGRERYEILHGSTRSTREACETLAAEEMERTGVVWEVVRA